MKEYIGKLLIYSFCNIFYCFIQWYLDVSTKSYYNPLYDFILIEVIYDKLFRS